MNSWFRFYNQAIRDPKVMRLSDADFRLWISMLAVASEHGGHIPPLDDLKLLLNRRLDYLLSGLTRLVKAELIDELAFGYEPHNWTKFQYKSDTSNDRVKRYRERQRNTDVAPPEPESDTEKNRAPLPPADGGSGSGHDARALAQELCKRTGIGNAGEASVGHVRRWLADGISAATIRTIVGEMAAKGGATRSLKRFDQPIRRGHVERRGGNGVRPPMTIPELESAARYREDHGEPEKAAEYRSIAEVLRTQAVSP